MDGLVEHSSGLAPGNAEDDQDDGGRRKQPPDDHFSVLISQCKTTDSLRVLHAAISCFKDTCRLISASILYDYVPFEQNKKTFANPGNYVMISWHGRLAQLGEHSLDV